MLHKLTSWEDNGYHDSYFYISVWDDQKREVRAIETGSTAYAGGSPEGDAPAISDPKVLMDALVWLQGHIYTAIREAEHRDVLEPQAAKRGDMVRLLRDCKHDGKVYRAGTVGEVCWSGAYGQFFAKGYNRPGRGNTRVGIRISPEPNAPMLFFPLKACRLDREPMGDTELQERAARLALHCGFSVATGLKHAWDSRNYALDLLKSVEGQSNAA